MNTLERLTATIALASTAGGLYACAGGQDAPEAKPQEPIAVTVAAVTAVQGSERLEAGGVVEAQEHATLSSRMLATIVEVRVRAGDRVRSDDALVTLDARDVMEQTRQAQASALAAENLRTQAGAEQHAAAAEHRLATAWQKRITGLHARDSATDQERDEADARLSAAAARLAGASAAVDAGEAQLAAARAGLAVATATESFATVRAPFDGLVTERLADPGNLAAPGTPLLRVESEGARQVVARIDEARAAYVRPGDQVRVLIDESGEPASTEGFEAEVIEVARAVGADQRAFAVKVSLPRSVTARSGTFARVLFDGPPRRALRIPGSAVRRQGQVSTVFVVQKDVAHLRLIQVGDSTSSGVEVLAGLDAGEAIVTSPPPALMDGSLVAGSRAGAPSGGSQ
jgi:multidrug efflux pump subunit AcrA (membrane-fusion protein)